MLYNISTNKIKYNQKEIIIYTYIYTSNSIYICIVISHNQLTKVSGVLVQGTHAVQKKN